MRLLSLRRRSLFRYFYFACVPSQKGGFLVRWHAHKATCSVFLMTNSTGSLPVPLWEPSQNGSLMLFPQLHQEYVPGWSLTLNGMFFGIRPTSSYC